MKFRFSLFIGCMGIVASYLFLEANNDYAQQVEKLKKQLIEQYNTALFIAERSRFGSDDVPGKFSGDYYRLHPQFQALLHSIEGYEYYPGEDEYRKVTLPQWNKELYKRTEQGDYSKITSIQQFPYAKDWGQTVWLYTLLNNEYQVKVGQFRPQYELRELYDFAFILTEFVHELGKLVPSDIPLDSFVLDKQLPTDYKEMDIPKYIQALQRIVNFNETALNDLKNIVKLTQPSKTAKKEELIKLMKKFGMY